MKIQFKSEEAFKEYCGLWEANSYITNFMDASWDSIITVDRIDTMLGEKHFFWDIAVDPRDDMPETAISWDEAYLFNIIEK